MILHHMTYHVNRLYTFLSTKKERKIKIKIKLN